MIDLTGKHALIFGVASEDSIAWAIAKKLAAAGATISLAYQQRFRSRIMQLQKSGDIDIAFCQRCDVTQAGELDTFFTELKRPVDILVHSVAYAPPETFQAKIRDVQQEHFAQALWTSAGSLLAVARAAAPHLAKDASIITMTYLGGQRVVANYKLMGIAKAALEAGVRELASDLGPEGIRVNAISSGPIRTLAASQIGNFSDMLDIYERVAPLRRCVTQDDVGDMATFLGSDLSRNITGQTLFVDAGYSTLAMASLGE